MTGRLPDRVPAAFRRRRHPVSGLFFSQARAIRSLPPDLRQMLGEQVSGWSCAETAGVARDLKKHVAYADIETSDVRQSVLDWLNDKAETITLPRRPQSGRACEGCGDTYRPRRSDALYCKSACRQRAYRLRLRNS